MSKALLVSLAFVLFGAASAQAQPNTSMGASQDASAVAWLHRIAGAAREQNYTGTYIYQHGNRVEVFKITHLHDNRGEHEKLEVLDDTPREIVRHNDEVLCFEGDARSAIVEKRKFRNAFPELLPNQVDALLDNYSVKMGGVGRVTGISCRNIMLEPKDNLRYRYKLCADNATGMLLKVSMLNDMNEVMAQTAFTQISIGGKIDKTQLKPKLSGRKVVISSGKPMADDMGSNPSWSVSQLPPGFTKVMAVKRMLPGKDAPVRHMVFSDGLATVSVFIEPLAGTEKPVQGLSSRGVINVYARLLDGHQITVLGEVPPATVMQTGNSVVHQAKPTGMKP
ncbi:MAG: MucB/RseB C-terminal domain-containing protein [Sulfuricellaceae bacterium]